MRPGVAEAVVAPIAGRKADGTRASQRQAGSAPSAPREPRTGRATA